MAKGLKNTLNGVWRFYRDGFRGMTWGRPLVWLILLKAFILFAILRVFFFKPAMAGLSDEERSRVVGERLAAPSFEASSETGAAQDGTISPETYNFNQ
ncbi:MAG: DUF4492 domain-containing protein [Bacteroidales bacterium]|nr:DUF4492 domain-containing protein [Bacteroidales bacterium]